MLKGKRQNKRNKLTLPQKRFCEYIVIENMNQTDAYQKAYPKATRKSSEERGSQLSSKIIINNYIDELKAKYLKDKMKQIEELFPESMTQFKRILISAKGDGSRMEAIREIWDRIIPKEKKQTITIEVVNHTISQILVIIRDEIKDGKIRNIISERMSALLLKDELND
jgi:phage terminase small subunit